MELKGLPSTFIAASSSDQFLFRHCFTTRKHSFFNIRLDEIRLSFCPNQRYSRLFLPKSSSSNVTPIDEYYMSKCVDLAQKALGWTSPNPMVGCVIVRDGQVVGEGFHPQAGQPHAEVFALRNAGNLAENATAYVSLEPCNHYGRTPPCTEALIKAKIKKVVVGMVDPNPIVSSKGLDKLREAGIEVITSVKEDLCKKLNESYIHQMVTGKPFVTVRCSISSKGDLVNSMGHQASEKGGYYSKMLQQYDAVVVSSSLVDQFSCPNSLESYVKQPLIVVISTSQKSIKIPSNLSASNVVIFTDEVQNGEAEVAQEGVESVALRSFNLEAILEFCKGRGMCSVVVDLRGNLIEFDELFRGAMENNLVQKVVCEIFPEMLDSDGSSFDYLGGFMEKLRPLVAGVASCSETKVIEMYI